MISLTVIREAGNETICYIAEEKFAQDKLEDAIIDYEAVENQKAENILEEYADFVAYGAKDTPSYIFTRGNEEDWYIAQAEIKENKIT